MQIIENPQQANLSNGATSNEKRIFARVVVQDWGGRKGNDAIFVEEKEVDVTDAILLLGLEAVVQLEDGSEGTDEVGLAHVDHSGPLEVYVTSSICDFFAVDHMEDITADAFEEARRLINPQPPEVVRTTIEIEVTARVLPGADKATAFDNLSIVVGAEADNVIVAGVRRLAQAAGQSTVLPAADPSLPQFMQLLALANAVTVDNGAILTDWTRSPWLGVPMNEVLRFAWTDGELDYSVTLTEEGIETGTFDDTGRFFATDHEGTLVMIRFFKLNAIGLGSLTVLH